MIVWLNGPHGVGKTSVARRLVRIGRGRRLLDPEAIGRRLQRSDRGDRPADFKDLPAWREQTVDALRKAAELLSGDAVIVPMTLPDPRYHAEIIGGLGQAGLAVCQVTLMARPDTLRRRIAARLDWPRSKRWALARVDSGVAALADDMFAPHVWTDELRLDEVVSAVEGHIRGEPGRD